MNDLLNLDISNGVATLSLDDGKANVMSLRMLQAINTALDAAQAEQAIVVIRGRPGMFSGGFDLSAFKGEPQMLFDMLLAGAELAYRLQAHPQPVVAACTGHAIAMGAFILLSSDLRIGVNEGARMQANEVQIGLTLPRFASEVCRQRLNPAHLQRVAALAQPYEGQQAVAAGFLDEAVPPEQLTSSVSAHIERLRKLHAASFTATKLRLRAPGLAALREAITQDRQDWAARFLPPAAH